MPNLASLILAAYFYVHAAMNMSGVPMPVVIETGTEYSYSEIYSAITVPQDWQGDCKEQKQVVYQMAEHFNAFRNGMRKKPDSYLIGVRDKWVCVQ